MTLIGRTLGKYRLIERLTSGAFSDVYRGLQIGLDRAVVIKVLPPALAADDTLRARFRRAGLTTARLSHPNIVTIFDSGETDGLPYTVMEELSPLSLDERLEREGPMSWPDVLKLGHDLAKALAYAHSREVCHRDLTPARIKFDQRSNAILTDFARADHPGTPAADLTAVGVILHAALTGDLDAKRAPWPTEAPPELTELIDALLTSGFTTARELFARLKEVELRLRARHLTRALDALPPPVLEDEPPMPTCESSDSLSFLESLTSIMSDDRDRREVARAFTWAAPMFLLTLCCALMLWR